MLRELAGIADVDREGEYYIKHPKPSLLHISEVSRHGLPIRLDEAVVMDVPEKQAYIVEVSMDKA